MGRFSSSPRTRLSKEQGRRINGDAGRRSQQPRRSNNDDGDVPVAAVYKMIKQQGIKHHGIKAKLEQPSARTEAHRRALATTALTRRWCCQPRGRKATSGVLRQNQATRAGWLDAQGIGRAGTGFAETVETLWRWRKHDGAAAVATRKTEEEKRRTVTMPGL